MFTILPVSAAAAIRSVCRHNSAGICTISATSAMKPACTVSWTSVVMKLVSELFPHGAQHLQPSFEPGAAVRQVRLPVGFVKRRLEHDRNVQALRQCCKRSAVRRVSPAGSMTHGPR